ncbi:TorF family putative porin [Sphingomonas pruni]|uniref:TorF family putative porin n=1 Tax=Sphingomonas pruni TaxID=40683 RepID=UPI000B21A3D7|nr:TorF family putative porin [Sphingomonas pruni]
MIYRFAAIAAASLLAAMPAAAQEEPPKPVTVSANVALVSDYRFRGVSQSDKQAALQGGVTVAHESGVYAGAWASNLAGWGTFGGANLELDLFAGIKKPIASGTTIDIGVTWYMYPGGAETTDFAEPYIKLGKTIGPANLLAGIAYAPKQKALGNFSNTPQSRGQAQDNLYLWGDANIGIPRTPLTAKAHLGHSNGNPGLGPNGTSVTPTGEYFDWSLGVDYVIGPVTLGVSYVDTDIGKARSAYLLPNFASTKNGSSIADATALFSVSAAF